jgi:flagellar hook protein FlgE
MSITSSLFTGVSGLNSNGQWLSTIGDNIANVNTIGFKGSTMSFGDILSQTLTGLSGTSQIGRGVSVLATKVDFSQGSFQNTSSGLDLAIDGDGFFVVNNGGATEYTRAGGFHLDNNGNIVTASGAILQGYLANATGTITGAIGNLSLLSPSSAARATTTGTLVTNLAASATVPAAWTFATGANPPAAAQYNNSTTETVYDSLGGAHQVGVYFANTATANQWAAHYVYQNSAGNYVEAGSQTLTFSNAGVLTAGASSGALTFAWGGSPANSTVTFDMTGTTQFSAAFAVSSLTQDGYSSGDLKNVFVNDTGIITGIFTNGQTRNLGQVALAKFPAPTKLVKLGNNLYSQSADSGSPVVDHPSTSGLGRILSSSLELSNVDLAQEFTNLISAQRGFQANTKIITTTDELLNLLISIKQ